MVTKTHTAAAKSSSTKALNNHAPHAGEKVHSTDETTGERLYQRYQQAQSDMLSFFGAPGWKRTIVALLASFVVGYAIGSVAATILEWMMVGALIAGTSTFVAMAVYAIGVVITLALSWRACGRVAGAILTDEADERAIAAYDATKNFVAKLNPMRLFGTPKSATVH